MPAVESTLRRPTKKELAQFRLGKIGEDTIQTFLEMGYSLAICCRDCPRIVEWTPPELEKRFAGRLGVRIADLAPKFTCAGEEGCGSHDIAVFPHLYDGTWVWLPPRH